MDLYEAFDRAVASTAGIVKTVRPDQAGAPTPCTEWDVRDLLNHIIGTLWLSEALLSDRAARHPMAPGGLPGTDLADPDPAAAYAEASAAALTAASVGDTLTRVHPTPLGDMPGPALAGFTTLDIAVHGWDLARATGQDDALDPHAVALMLPWTQANAELLAASGMFGTRIDTGPGVPDDVRLLGMLGRRA